jgi:hypothetical protein
VAAPAVLAPKVHVGAGIKQKKPWNFLRDFCVCGRFRAIAEAAMPLIPTAQAAIADCHLRAVRFAMKDGSKMITVLVSNPA